MNVTRLMPLIYPFICYFVQKRLFGGKKLFCGKTTIRGKTAISRENYNSNPVCTGSCGRIEFSLRSSAEYSTTQYSVILLEVFREWKWLFSNTVTSICFICALGLCAPVHAQYRQQLGGRIPFCLYIVWSGCPEIEERFSSNGSFWRNASLRLLRNSISWFSYQY